MLVGLPACLLAIALRAGLLALACSLDNGTSCFDELHCSVDIWVPTFDGMDGSRNLERAAST